MEEINWGWGIIYLDSEFFNTKEEHVAPVCAVAYNSNTGEVIKFWAFEEPRTQELFREYCEKNKDEVWCSFAVTAEARYFLAHGIDPVKFRWVDLFIEYKQISNHNDRIAYGMQLVNGSPKMTRRPPAKWQRTEEDSGSSYRQTHSLAEATYKLCGIVRDSEEKDLMRDIIIRGDRDKILENKKRILDYCYEDTIYLEEIEKAIKKEFEELLDFNELMSLKEEMYLRGKYSALTGRMESFGYPINYEQAKNFSDSVKSILNDCQSEINELFPGVKPFRWNAKTFSYTWNQGVTKDWIRNNVPDVGRWMTTDSGDISLSLEAWTRFFDFKHDYPKDNFGAQMVRYLKLKQNLNGFSPNNKGEKRTFWDSVGSDHRVRPYMNHYGAQSSRSQPAATGFLFLKPAWMRSLCQPKKGKAIGGFDYGSQEFLISALVSKDENMLWAYESGDVYLAFAKLAGAVPMDGTKDEYKKERDLFKATTLGVSYLMTKVGLAAKLSADTGRKVSEEEAQELIDLFYSSYPDFAIWQKTAIENYIKKKEKIKLEDGWYMFTDNDNFRSAANMPIQGRGAAAMRKAVEFCWEEGLNVIFTLHDAIYIEYDSDDVTAMDKLYDCMLRGFIHYFEDKKAASLIRLDGKVWSPDYTSDNLLLDSYSKKNKKTGELETFYEFVTAKGKRISASEIFIDERALGEYKQFSKYFESSGDELL